MQKNRFKEQLRTLFELEVFGQQKCIALKCIQVNVKFKTVHGTLQKMEFVQTLVFSARNKEFKDRLAQSGTVWPAL